MKILVADDEPKIGEQLKKYLELKGHSVDVVIDGDEALKLIKDGDYGIVFLDENMPGLTGLEVIKYIKTHGFKLKTIILTGYPYINEEFSKIIGADEYLEKPVDLKKIDEMVKKYQSA